MESVWLEDRASDHYYFFPLKKKIFCKELLWSGPVKGPCLVLGKQVVSGDTCTDKAEDCIGKRWSSGEQRIWEPGRPALPLDSVSAFWWGLVSRLSAASHLACAPIWSSPGPFPGGRAHLSQDGEFLGGCQDILWADVVPSFWPPRVF